MQSKASWGLVWGAFLIAGVVAPTRSSVAANCALWARAATGIDLVGAAAGWWNGAEGRYGRGHLPAEGAILVFMRTGHMPSGHVAVVSRVIGEHEILIDHANWHRGTVSRGMSVIDTSPNHDWTTVAVIDLRSGKYGRDNPTYGFIYPTASPREVAPEIIAASYSPYVAESGLFQLAVGTEDRHASVHRGRTMRASHHRAASSRLFLKATATHRHGHHGPAHTGSARASAHASGASSHATRPTVTMHRRA